MIKNPKRIINQTMSYRLILFLASLLTADSILAQTDILNINEKKKRKDIFDFGMEGMIGAAGGIDFYSFNVGGPSLFFRITKDIKVGIGAFPSLYINKGKLGAKLGVGPRFDYKNFVLFTTFFHFENANVWKWSAGAGYKFHRKSKK